MSDAKITMEFTMDELYMIRQSLIVTGLIRGEQLGRGGPNYTDYTKRLAEANKQALSEKDQVSLELDLKAHKELFNSVAGKFSKCFNPSIS